MWYQQTNTRGNSVLKNTDVSTYTVREANYYSTRAHTHRETNRPAHAHLYLIIFSYWVRLVIWAVKNFWQMFLCLQILFLFNFSLLSFFFFLQLPHFLISISHGLNSRGWSGYLKKKIFFFSSSLISTLTTDVKSCW